MTTKCSHCYECRNSRCSYADCPFDADTLGEILEKVRAENATLRARVAKMEEALKYIKREAGDRSEKAWFRLDTIMDEADAALTEGPAA